MKKLFIYSIKLIIVFLPNTLKRFVLNRFFDCKIHKTAKIGFSFIDVKKITIGPYAKIGHLNIFKGLEKLEMGQYSTIGNLNEFSALPLESRLHFKTEKNRYPALILNEHSGIVKKHFFDCNNTITIGKFTTIAGIGSIFFTHGISIKKNLQETKPINIGDYCMIGTGCIILKGSILPNGSLLSANSTLDTPYNDNYHIYSGVPAVPVKKLCETLPWYDRTKGRVD